jgi:hypothetical protein
LEKDHLVDVMRYIIELLFPYHETTILHSAVSSPPWQTSRSRSSAWGARY